MSRTKSEEGRSVEELVGNDVGCCGVFGWWCDGSGEGVLVLVQGRGGVGGVGGGMRVGGGWEGGGGGGVMLVERFEGG